MKYQRRPVKILNAARNTSIAGAFYYKVLAGDLNGGVDAKISAMTCFKDSQLQAAKTLS